MIRIIPKKQNRLAPPFTIRPREKAAELCCTVILGGLLWGSVEAVPRFVAGDPTGSRPDSVFTESELDCAYEVTASVDCGLTAQTVLDIRCTGGTRIDATAQSVPVLDGKPAAVPGIDAAYQTGSRLDTIHAAGAQLNNNITTGPLLIAEAMRPVCNGE